MFKKLLWGMFLIGTAQLFAQNVTIPDANFKAALVADTLINTNKDGEIQVSEAIAFTGTIDVNSDTVSNLLGLEEFPNITRLVARNNSINSIDLSNNLELTFINIEKNNLSTIDVSNNTLLTSLDVGHNNLTSIDLSKNTLLKSIVTKENEIESLNISNNTELTFVDIGVGPLASLDISNNTKIEHLWVHYSDISNLDVSHLTNLKSVWAYGTNIDSINVTNSPLLTALRISSNKGITTVDVSNNPKLTQLEVYGTDIISVDVSNNPLLRTLTAGGSTELQYINVKNGGNDNITKFIIASSPNLSCIQVDDSIYSKTNWTQVDSHIQFIEGDECPCYVEIPDANFKAALVANTAINTNEDSEISCSEAEAYTGEIDVTGLGISDLTGIETFTSLTTLNCASNNLTDLDISNNTMLTVLYCSGNTLNTLDVSKNISLKNLFAASTGLSILDVSKNTNLEDLRVSNNTISSLDLSTNTALKFLRANGNSLSSIDVSTNLALIQLFVNSNAITTIDISSNTSLMVVRVNDNELTSLNVANGNNTIITSFIATDNANLSCIQVDDSTYSANNWTDKDAHTLFSEDCNLLVGFNSIKSSVNISPQPTNGFITVSGIELKEVTILNATGVEVTKAFSNQIDLGSFPAGLYLLKIRDNNNRLYSQRVLKY